MAVPEKKKKYTYADYVTWPDDIRVELIHGEVYPMGETEYRKGDDGKVHAMTPAPRPKHQRISSKLLQLMANALDSSPCEVYSAPFDVLLDASTEQSTAEQSTRKSEYIVQPDLSIICDPKKIGEQGCLGPPDLVVEITSKSSASRDHITKYELYQNYGVPEYWIVEPEYGIVLVHHLGDDGKYAAPVRLDTSGTIESKAVPGLLVPLAGVFPTDEDEKKAPLPEGLLP
jgi:Uma2 family endonuclease